MAETTTDEMVGSGEAMKLLKVSSATFYRWVALGFIKQYKVPMMNPQYMVAELNRTEIIKKFATVKGGGA